MEREWQERVEKLEREVQQLTKELAELKQQNRQQPKEQPSAIRQLVPQFERNAVEKPAPEVISGLETKAVQEKQAVTPKPKRSFEERITTILPKVFMIILVLGILWGLKLASDFGLLSDTLKVFAAYIVSIAIGIYAWRSEKNKVTLSPMLVALYGGSFIIGILATAAGAILYEIFTLTFALIIAVLYVAYGIAISYVKGSEALSSFVVFTSLLLPYLLEFMDFSKLFILIYVVLIFMAMQLVIMKHNQHIALYIGMFFSLLAIQILWFTQFKQTPYFAMSYIVVLALFLKSWWQLFKRSEKWKLLQQGALFSISSFTLLLLNLIIFDEPYQIIYLFIVFALYALMAFVVYKNNERQVFDISATIAMLLTFNIVLTFDFAVGYSRVALVLSAVAGIMLAIRLRAPLMKVTYTALLFLMAFALYFTTDVRPFWHVENIALLVLIISIVSAYIYAKMPKEEPTHFEQLIDKYYIIDSIAAAIVLFLMLYMTKLDYAYISTAQYIPYIVFSVTAISMLIAFIVNHCWIGNFVPIILIVCYLTQGITLLSTGLVDDTHIFLQLVTRGIFILTLLALLADLYEEGRIYQKWQKFIEKYIEIYMISGIFIITLYFINLISYLEMIDGFTWGIAIMLKTLTLFTIASLTIIIGRRKQWKKVAAAGFILLLIAILKLIFFDLATLNLLIRAILFIVVGAAGMLLSGRLLRK
ncbi:DUF2339 domain-containing protein [Metasolibacillus sp. FSL H7-0170]|uniref:DUF2339 domain-containing protein n=1 Tax=Metasolibacillus sp. FSL H7-0170 TaxID=2921431 RepID=UPI0031581324